jgi:hypothetical protein
MIRSLYPIDLILLVFSSRRMLPNEAMARDSPDNRSLLSPEAFLEHWLPLGGRRHSWVLAGGVRILGVVSIRSCSSPTIWQVDYLQAGDEECCLALLDRVSAAAAKRGVRRLFLRLPSASPLIDGARHSGFSRYGIDYLYRYHGEGGRRAAEAPGPYLLRPRSSGDEYGLFELYNATVPLQVRTVEGMTLEEWQESRGRGSWLEQHREFVIQKQGGLVGWLRVNAARGMGCFEIMFHQLDEDGLEWLVNYALMCLDGKSPVFCVASAFQGQLSGLLQRLGFEQVAEYSSLMKEIALRVREPHFIPMRA